MGYIEIKNYNYKIKKRNSKIQLIVFTTSPIQKVMISTNLLIVFVYFFI